MENKTDKLEQLLENSREAARSKQHDLVLKFCKKALEISPDDTRFLFMFGTALHRQKNYEKAISSLEKVTKKAPNLSIAHHDLGTAYLSVGKLKKAKEHGWGTGPPCFP